MSIYYLSNANTWESTDNSTLMKVEEMLQRMQTWKSERQFNANDGVDFLGVLAKTAFLKPQLELIAEDYAVFFDTTVEDISSDGENIAVKLVIVLQSGVIAREIIV